MMYNRYLQTALQLKPLATHAAASPLQRPPPLVHTTSRSSISVRPRTVVHGLRKPSPTLPLPGLIPSLTVLLHSRRTVLVLHIAAVTDVGSVCCVSRARRRTSVRLLSAGRAERRLRLAADFGAVHLVQAALSYGLAVRRICARDIVGEGVDVAADGFAGAVDFVEGV